MHPVYWLLLAIVAGLFALGAALTLRRPRNPREGDSVLLRLFLELPDPETANRAGAQLIAQGYEADWETEADCDPDDVEFPERDLVASVRLSYSDAVVESRVGEFQGFAHKIGGEFGGCDFEVLSGSHQVFGTIFMLFVGTGVLVHVLYYAVTGSFEMLPVAENARASLPPAWVAAWLGLWALLSAKHRVLSSLLGEES